MLFFSSLLSYKFFFCVTFSFCLFRETKKSLFNISLLHFCYSVDVREPNERAAAVILIIYLFDSNHLHCLVLFCVVLLCTCMCWCCFVLLFMCMCWCARATLTTQHLRRDVVYHRSVHIYTDIVSLVIQRLLSLLEQEISRCEFYSLF